eukprot:6233566-Pyramimonas_sp.AAC.1
MHGPDFGTFRMTPSMRPASWTSGAPRSPRARCPSEMLDVVALEQRVFRVHLLAVGAYLTV